MHANYLLRKLLAEQAACRASCLQSKLVAIPAQFLVILARFSETDLSRNCTRLLAKAEI